VVHQLQNLFAILLNSIFRDLDQMSADSSFFVSSKKMMILYLFFLFILKLLMKEENNIVVDINEVEIF